MADNDGAVTPVSPRRASVKEMIGSVLSASFRSPTRRTVEKREVSPIKAERATSCEDPRDKQLQDLNKKLADLQTTCSKQEHKISGMEKELSEQEERMENVEKEAVDGIDTLTFWSRVNFLGFILCTAFFALLARASPVSLWLALTQGPTVGMEIIMTNGSLNWRPAAILCAVYCALLFGFLAALTFNAIRDWPRRIAWVALLVLDAVFFLYRQEEAKEILRNTVTSLAAQTGSNLSLSATLMVLDAVMLFGFGLMEMAFLYSHIELEENESPVTKRVQKGLGRIRRVLPIFRPVLFRGAIVIAFTLYFHPQAASLEVCTSTDSCPSNKQRTPLECAPPSASIYDWLSHSITGENHILRMDCHGDRPKMGESEWLACRAFLAAK